MDRSRTLLFLARGDQFQLLLRDYPLPALCQVLHLQEETLRHTDASKEQRSVRIGVNRWVNQFPRPAVWREFISTWLRRLRRRQVDLLIVENILLLREPDFTGQVVENHLSNLLRPLRKWADELGCGLLLSARPARDVALPPLLEKLLELPHVDVALLGVRE